MEGVRVRDVTWRVRLEQGALARALGRQHWAEDGADRLVEHRLQPLLRQRATLEVLDSADLLCHRQALGNDAESLLGVETYLITKNKRDLSIPHGIIDFNFIINANPSYYRSKCSY